MYRPSRRLHQEFGHGEDGMLDPYNPKTAVIRLRVTPDQHALIRQHAERNEMLISDFVRWLIQREVDGQAAKDAKVTPPKRKLATGRAKGKG